MTTREEFVLQHKGTRQYMGEHHRTRKLGEAQRFVTRRRALAIANYRNAIYAKCKGPWIVVPVLVSG